MNRQDVEPTAEGTQTLTTISSSEEKTDASVSPEAEASSASETRDPHHEDPRQEASPQDAEETADKGPEGKAEESAGTASSGNSNNWWSGWYDTAVNKSTQAMDFMRKDLTELTTAVQSESASLINSSSTVLSAVSSTASYLKDAVSSLVEEDEEEEEAGEGRDQREESSDGKVTEEKEKVVLSPEELEVKMREREAAFDQEVKQMLQIPETLALAAGSKLSAVFHSLVDVLTPIGYGADGDDSDDVVLLPNEQTIARDRWDLLMRAIQSDPRTYCHEPDGAPEDFDAWLTTFTLRDAEVQRILHTSPEVREHHATLVPDQMTSDDFWRRYFYRIETLKQCESRRAKMLKERATDQQKDSSSDSKSVSSGRADVQSLKLREEERTGSSGASNTGTPVTPAEGKNSGATSDEWEKTSLTDIVDEAAAKLAHKLNTLPPDTRSDEELNEWEFE